MGFDAKWYCLLHKGNPGDVSFYKAATRGAESVLELGCGAGRIGIPLAKSGIAVTGVDVSKEMTARLEEVLASCPKALRQRVEVVCGDMRDMDLGRKFSKVIIPYNGLLCMTSEKDVHRTLQTAGRHLAPGGELIFDIYYVPGDFFDDGEEPEDAEFSHIASIDTDDAPVHVFEKSLPHKDPRRFDTAYRYQIDKPFGEIEIVCEYTIAQRCMFAEEIPDLLANAGFELTSMTGDFKNRPINEATNQLVVRACLVAVADLMQPALS